MSRTVRLYGYLSAVAASLLVLNIVFREGTTDHPDRLDIALYLVVAVLILNFVGVRLDRGRLTLAAAAAGAAPIRLNRLHAAWAGLAIAPSLFRRGRWAIVGDPVMVAAMTCSGAIVALQLRGSGALPLWARLVVLLTVDIGSWLLVAMFISIVTREPIRRIAQLNFTPSFYLAFGYFNLASLLVSYVLDGSDLGFLLATIVFVLALALTDTIAGRRVRRGLESEVSDADRHLFHSRAVEGVVHNLRNHVATAVGYLKEIRQERLDPVDRDAVNMAAEAANDAVVVLRSLSQGATPKVSYALEPTDLNELVTRALSMARPRARSKEIQLAIREAPDDVRAKADPLLLREVITNLVNNAIDAAPMNGRVELRTGRRANGWPYFSIADNGPGVLDDNRHHLFEPHFTTKEGGTGLGLFMSYGIVKEHQGRLVYEGNRKGAIFTVTLPPFGG